MIGGDQDQRLARVFLVKLIRQRHGAVEFAVIMDHRREIREMAGSIDVFVFYECEKAVWIVIMQMTYCRARHVIDRGLAVFISVNFKAHLLIAEQSEEFTARRPLELKFVGNILIALLFERGDRIGFVDPLAAGLALRDEVLFTAAQNDVGLEL